MVTSAQGPVGSAPASAPGWAKAKVKVKVKAPGSALAPGRVNTRCQRWRRRADVARRRTVARGRFGRSRADGGVQGAHGRAARHRCGTGLGARCGHDRRAERHDGGTAVLPANILGSRQFDAAGGAAYLHRRRVRVRAANPQGAGGSATARRPAVMARGWGHPTALGEARRPVDRLALSCTSPAARRVSAASAARGAMAICAWLSVGRRQSALRLKSVLERISTPGRTVIRACRLASPPDRRWAIAVAVC